MSESKKRYRVLLNGQNFLLDYEGGPRRMGFYTTRYVEAADAIEAERVAVELIRDDKQLLATVRNRREDPPMLYASEIEEVDAIERSSGFSFYPEGESTE